MAAHDGKVSIDASRWPIVVITQHVTNLTDQERASALMETDTVIESRPGRYAMVLDNRQAGPLSPTQRILIAEYAERTVERVRLRRAATAMIVSTEVMRMMVTAIQWKIGKHGEMEVFDQLETALRWAQERMQMDRAAGSG